MDIEKWYEKEIGKVDEEKSNWFTQISTDYLASYNAKNSKAGAEAASKLLRSCLSCGKIFTLMQAALGNCPSCGQALTPTQVEYDGPAEPVQISKSNVTVDGGAKSNQGTQGIASSSVNEATDRANASLNDVCPECGKAIPEYLKGMGICPYCKTKGAAKMALKMLKKI